MVVYPLAPPVFGRGPPLGHFWPAPLCRDEYSSWPKKGCFVGLFFPKKSFRQRVPSTWRERLWVSIRWVGAGGEGMKHIRAEAAILDRFLEGGLPDIGAET